MNTVFPPQLTHDLAVKQSHGYHGDQEHQHGQTGGVDLPLLHPGPHLQATGVDDVVQEVVLLLRWGVQGGGGGIRGMGVMGRQSVGGKALVSFAKASP